VGNDFQNPDCSCDHFKGGVRVLPACPVHGEGTDYWEGMTVDRDRILQAANKARASRYN